MQNEKHEQGGESESDDDEVIHCKRASRQKVPVLDSEEGSTSDEYNSESGEEEEEEDDTDCSEESDSEDDQDSVDGICFFLVYII